MGRPRKTEGPSAAKKLQDAFFDEINETPFQDITVTSLVTRAEVNRNSFYYHYVDLNDLARTAVTELLNESQERRSLAQMLAQDFAVDAPEFDSTLKGLLTESRVRKISSIAGTHSTAELRSILKRAIVDVWFEEAGLDLSDIDKTELVTIRFMLGGLLELYGSADIEDPARRFHLVRKLPLRAALTQELSSILKNAIERRARRLQEK